MSPRERILTVLEGRVPDRVPVTPFIQEEFLSWVYPDRAELDRVDTVIELAEQIPFDIITKHKRFMTPPFMVRDHPNWRVRRSQTKDGALQRTCVEIVTPNRTLTEESVVPDAGAATSGLMPAVRKHLLEDAADIAAFIEWLPEPDGETVSAMQSTMAAWTARLGDKGINAPWGWAGVFNAAADLCSIESIMTAPYEDPDSYAALMDRITSYMISYNQRLAEAGADAIGIQGHIANAASVDPSYFETYVLPYEKRLVNAIHQAGAYSIYHNCGCARRLYPHYKTIGMSLWETVSEPPQGDNDLAAAKQELGDTICLLGNLDQIHFLKTASPAQVADKTREIVRIGKPGGRYFFAASDFLEHNTPMENVRAMLAAAADEGRY